MAIYGHIWPYMVHIWSRPSAIDRFSQMAPMAMAMAMAMAIAMAVIRPEHVSMLKNPHRVTCPI